jgi:hypothetical protein
MEQTGSRHEVAPAFGDADERLSPQVSAAFRESHADNFPKEKPFSRQTFRL